LILGQNVKIASFLRCWPMRCVRAEGIFHRNPYGSYGAMTVNEHFFVAVKNKGKVITKTICKKYRKNLHMLKD